MRARQNNTLFFALLAAMFLSAPALAGPPTETGDAIEAPDTTSESRFSRFEDLGTDLVIAKVKYTRGRFAGENKVQVVAYVRNMCNQGTSARFDVYVPFVTKLWVTGIGPKQTKSSGAFYLSTNVDSPTSPALNVTVDHDNMVKENNETNNTCDHARVSFAAGETGSKTYDCPIIKPTCRSRSPIDKERELQIRPGLKN
jgi:hypothetical protein